MNQHSISQSVFDRIVAFLSNLFLHTVGHDPDRARDAVLEALAEYDPRTNRELRLAALALAFSLGALDALSRAVEEDLTLNQMLRLRSSANALHRSACHAEQALAEERETPETTLEEAPLPASTESQDLTAFARSAPPLSRQQRRKKEREIAKRLRRQEDRARQAAKDAHRAMHQVTPALTSPLPPAAIFPPGTAGAGAYATSVVA